MTPSHPNPSTSLVVVGTGIKFLSHLTTEARTYIEQADKVLYLVNDPAMKEWLQKSNAHTESLDALYTKYPLRLQCYQAITAHILASLQAHQHLCVVLYGHPTVFSQPALDAVIQAREAGYDARVLPGISAEDCLFADLLIDPGAKGCQSFETTDFLVRQRKFDPSSHLILWQVGVIGVLDRPTAHDNSLGVNVLIEYLKPHYKLTHRVTLYEAAQYPGFEPRKEMITLSQLSTAEFSTLSTLYVPPAYQATCDKAILAALNLS